MVSSKLLLFCVWLVWVFLSGGGEEGVFVNFVLWLH